MAPEKPPQENPIDQIKQHIAAHSGEQQVAHLQALEQVLGIFDKFAEMHRDTRTPEPGAIMVQLRLAQTRMGEFLTQIGMPKPRDVTATVVGKYMQDVSQHAPQLSSQGEIRRG